MTQKENSSRATLLMCLALALICLIIYMPVQFHSFVLYDDPLYVTGNQQVLRGLTPAGIRWAATTFHASNWHPVTWISHMVDVELFGVQPGAHHMVNVLFHALNSILLFILFTRMTGHQKRSWVLAALFLVHPLHVESVAWVAERKDVLSTFFAILTLLRYDRYARRPGWTTYSFVFLFFALGLMSKPMLITLPFVLILMDIWPLQRIRFSPLNGRREAATGDSGATLWRSLVEKIPLLMLSGFSGYLTVIAQQRGGTVANLEIIPFSVRLANALVSYYRYVEKIVWPEGLAVFYPHAGMPDAGILLWSLAVFSLITVWALRGIHSRPWRMVGWLWYVGTLIPVIGLVQVGGQAMADRYTYLPSIGLFLAVSWEFFEVQGTFKRRNQIAMGTLVLVMVACSVVAHIQLKHWKNSTSLFRRAVQVTSQNAVAQYNLGLAYSMEGDLQNAIPHFRKALQIQPGHWKAHNNLGMALSMVGKKQEAIEHFKKALRIHPSDIKTQRNLDRILNSDRVP